MLIRRDRQFNITVEFIFFMNSWQDTRLSNSSVIPIPSNILKLWEYKICTYENTQYVRIFPRKLRIHDTYVWEYTIRTDFSVQITRYDTQCVRIFPRTLHDTILSTYVFPRTNYTIWYIVHTDLPVRITQYVRILNVRTQTV